MIGHEPALLVFYTGVDGKREQGCLCVASRARPRPPDQAEGPAPGARGRRQHQGGHGRARGRRALPAVLRIRPRQRLAHRPRLADDPCGPWQVAADPFTVREDLWDTWHLSTGPILARDGQPPVMFYNGATADARWRIGWIAFDENYTRVVDRCIEPLLVPPPAQGARRDRHRLRRLVPRPATRHPAVLLARGPAAAPCGRSPAAAGVSPNVNVSARRLARIGSIGVLTPVDMWKITLQSREFVVNTVSGGTAST